MSCYPSIGMEITGRIPGKYKKAISEQSDLPIGYKLSSE